VGALVASLGTITPLAFAGSAGDQFTSVAVGGSVGGGSGGDNASATDSSTTGGESRDFDAQGTISTRTDITESLSYDLEGSWNMQVRGGEVTQFDATMAATPSDTNLGKPHSHELLNYQPTTTGVLDSDNNFFTSGLIDVGTNGKVSWQNVPVAITFRNNGETITITVDDTKAGHHFAGQPLTGTIESITPCQENPGPAMSIENLCEAAGTANDTGNNGGTSAGVSNGGSSGSQFTVTIDSDTFGPNEIPGVSGKVNDGAAGTVAQVDVRDSSGKVVYNTVAGVSSDGSFFTNLKEFSPGQYNVVVTYHGKTGTANFEVVETGT
ncbi:MAG TPA: hypothetical protein VFA15_07140, partial [Nitrososphaera sp.]|nr:hypothetical protein [Nitrososphaera sp.]